MKQVDIRWKQRFENLSLSVDKLRQALSIEEIV